MASTRILNADSETSLYVCCLDPDVAGFIYLPSFAHSYEVTKSPKDLRQALAAAEALSWAYNPGDLMNHIV